MQTKELYDLFMTINVIFHKSTKLNKSLFAKFIYVCVGKKRFKWSQWTLPNIYTRIAMFCKLWMLYVCLEHECCWEKESESLQLLVGMINGDFPFVKYTTHTHLTYKKQILRLIFHNNNNNNDTNKKQHERQIATPYIPSLIERINSYVSFVQCFQNFTLFYVLKIYCGAFALSPAKYIYTWDLCVSLLYHVCVQNVYRMVFGDLKYSRVLLFPCGLLGLTYISFNPIIVQ